MRALSDLGIDEKVARDVGIRVYKIALTWPLEPQGARRFAEGLEEILVVEEKRQVIEYQIKEELYNWKEGVRAPRVVGKFDDSGEWSRSGGQPAGTWLLPAHYEHSPAMVAKAIAQRLEKLGLAQKLGSQFKERLAFLEFKEKALAELAAELRRHAELVEPLRDGSRHHRRRMLVVRRQKPRAGRLAAAAAPLAAVVELADYPRRAHPFLPVVELFLDLVLDDLAFFLDDEDLLQALGEAARALRLERPR
jgi:hypothetical protein